MYYAALLLLFFAIAAFSADIRQIRLPAPIHSTVQTAGVTEPMAIQTEEGVTFAGTPLYQGKPKPLDTAQTKAGRLTFHVRIALAAEYTVGARVFWHDGASNSFWLKVDNQPYIRFGNDGDEKKWMDWKGVPVYLDTGTHTILFQEREPGSRIASLTLLPLPAFVSDLCRLKDSLMVSDSTQLLINPPYALADTGKAGFSLFLASKGAGGVLADKPAVPLTILDDKNRVLYQKPLVAGALTTVTLTAPLPEKLVIKAGQKQVEWRLFSKQLASLDKNIDGLKNSASNPKLMPHVIPSLMLYRENILRGWKRWRQDEVGLPSLAYILSQFKLAEQLIAAAQKRTPGKADVPGIREYAYYSAVDSVLCPYTLYLPKGYFADKKKYPLILYLHGTGGTQWELERSLAADNIDLNKLKVPAISAFYRGNPEFNDTISADLVQLVNFTCLQLRIDTTKLVISGFSRGGFFTWAMAYDYPEKFHLLIPIAGGPPWDRKGIASMDRLEFPEKFKGEVIILHSPEDGTVDISGARVMETLFARLKPRFIIYPGGHIITPDIVKIFNEFAK